MQRRGRRQDYLHRNPIIGSVVNTTDLFAHPYTYDQEFLMKSPTQLSPFIHINPDDIGKQKFSSEKPGKGNLTYSYGMGVQEPINVKMYVRNTLKSKDININRFLSVFPLPPNTTKTWYNS